MRPRLASLPLIRRIAIAIGVLSLGVGAAGSAFGAPGQTHPPGTDSHEHATIDTYGAWDGSTAIATFGRPDTSTYGQVITVPQAKTSIWRFSFYLTDAGSEGSLTMRGEVYRWNGTQATGDAVWESAPRVVDYADSGFHRESFNPHGAKVEPGETYVLFASVSKDYEDCTDGYPTSWASVSDSTYAPGTFVFLNDGGDESQWTTQAWTTTWGQDLAFKAHLR
jgi:hypothetical protein